MMRRVTTVIVALVLGAGSLLAASQPPPSAAGQGEFVPVSSLPASAEQLPAAPFLIGAYVVVWLALLGYVWSIWRRMKKIERELSDLQKRVQSR